MTSTAVSVDNRFENSMCWRTRVTPSKRHATQSRPPAPQPRSPASPQHPAQTAVSLSVLKLCGIRSQTLPNGCRRGGGGGIARVMPPERNWRGPRCVPVAPALQTSRPALRPQRSCPCLPRWYRSRATANASATPRTVRHSALCPTRISRAGTRAGDTVRAEAPNGVAPTSGKNWPSSTPTTLWPSTSSMA